MSVIASMSQGLRSRVAQPRVVLVAVLAVTSTWGLVGTSAEATATAVASAGRDLVDLLRFMAALKAVLALAAAAALVWRLGLPVSRLRLAGYGLAAAGMAAGPGLIWSMAHVGLGALLLHGGLLATLLMLWFDPGTTAALDTAMRLRRARPLAGAAPKPGLAVRPRPSPATRILAAGGARR